MRPPERIPLLLELLEQAWRRDPDMRLAQLITVAAVRGGWKHGADIFAAEDDVVEQGLSEMINSRK